MTKEEANEFVETMKEIGDEWTVEQALDAYSDKSLDEALTDRKASVGLFGDIINTILNR